MITRDEAAQLIFELSEMDDILNEELTTKLKDIHSCLEQESFGIHAWSMNDEDFMYLVTAHIADGSEESEAWFKKAHEIAAEHSFVPAPSETEEIKANLEEYEG